MKRRMRRNPIIISLLVICLLAQMLLLPAAKSAKAEETDGPDPNFHIYLAFGQSNMDGNATPSDDDKKVPDGYLKMCTDDGHSGETVGEWYPAEPPLARVGAGLGVADYFGRKMLEYKQESNPNARVGIICVAVPGCATDMFDKDKYVKYRDSAADWLQNIANNQYGGNPYGRMVECAKKAMEQGVIQGFIYHQGETDGNEGWADRMVVIYNNLIEDLGLEGRNIPFVAGECVPKMSGQNTNINKLKSKGDNFYVASSQGLSDKGDGLHFNAESYRTFGARYADIMIEAEPQLSFSDPEYTWAADNSTVTAKRTCNDIPDFVEEETANVTKTVTREATKDAPGIIEYTAEFTNPAFEKQTKTEEVAYVDNTPAQQNPTQTQPITTTPGGDSATAPTTTAEKTLKLASVKCKKNTKKITGKVSESGATVKVKVGSKTYKAKVSGKKFTATLKAKLKKNAKVIITVTKSGFKTFKKTYKVK